MGHDLYVTIPHFISAAAHFSDTKNDTVETPGCVGWAPGGRMERESRETPFSSRKEITTSKLVLDWRGQQPFRQPTGATGFRWFLIVPITESLARHCSSCRYWQSYINWNYLHIVIFLFCNTFRLWNVTIIVLTSILWVKCTGFGRSPQKHEIRNKDPANASFINRKPCVQRIYWCQERLVRTQTCKVMVALVNRPPRFYKRKNH